MNNRKDEETIEDVNAVDEALCNWLDDQSADRGAALPAMAGIIGRELGDNADSVLDLLDTLAKVTLLIQVSAFRVFEKRTTGGVQ